MRNVFKEIQTLKLSYLHHYNHLLAISNIALPTQKNCISKQIHFPSTDQLLFLIFPSSLEINPRFFLSHRFKTCVTLALSFTYTGSLVQTLLHLTPSSPLSLSSTKFSHSSSKACIAAIIFYII